MSYRGIGHAMTRTSQTCEALTSQHLAELKGPEFEFGAKSKTAREGANTMSRTRGMTVSSSSKALYTTHKASSRR